jgi:para-nitrobenzyl esterase
MKVLVKLTILAGVLLSYFAGAMAGTPPPYCAADLSGTSWQLVKFQGSDGLTLKPDDGSKYTLAFHGDGSLNARIDCNRGRSTWKSSEPGRLELGLLALTRAMCPPGSLHDRLVGDWDRLRSFMIRDGHLFISPAANGGTYEFEPVHSSDRK